MLRVHPLGDVARHLVPRLRKTGLDQKGSSNEEIPWTQLRAAKYTSPSPRTVPVHGSYPSMFDNVILRTMIKKTPSERSAQVSSKDGAEKLARERALAYARGQRTRRDGKVPGDDATKNVSEGLQSVVAAALVEARSALASGGKSEGGKVKIEEVKEETAKRKAAVKGEDLPPHLTMRWRKTGLSVVGLLTVREMTLETIRVRVPTLLVDITEEVDDERT